MFKKIVLTGMMVGVLGSIVLGAGALVRQVSKMQVLSISKTAWTAIASPTTDETRTGILLDIQNGTTDSFLIVMSTYNAVGPGVAGTTGLVMDPGNSPWDLPISKNVYLFGICTGDAAHNIVYQEYQTPGW